MEEYTVVITNSDTERTKENIVTNTLIMTSAIAKIKNSI